MAGIPPTLSYPMTIENIFLLLPNYSKISYETVMNLDV